MRLKSQYRPTGSSLYFISFLPPLSHSVLFCFYRNSYFEGIDLVFFFFFFFSSV